MLRAVHTVYIVGAKHFDSRRIHRAQFTGENSPGTIHQIEISPDTVHRMEKSPGTIHPMENSPGIFFNQQQFSSNLFYFNLK